MESLSTCGRGIVNEKGMVKPSANNRDQVNGNFPKPTVFQSIELSGFQILKNLFVGFYNLEAGHYKDQHSKAQEN